METTSLKTKIATFAAGALTVAMVPAGLANGDISGMFGLQNDAQTHVEAEHEDGSAMLHQGVTNDTSAKADASSDDGGFLGLWGASRAHGDTKAHVETDDASIHADGDVKNESAARVRASGDGEDSSVDVSGESNTDVDSMLHVESDDASAHLDGSARSDASANVSASGDDAEIGAHGNTGTDASVDADASSEDDGLFDILDGGLLDLGGSEGSNDDEDDSSGNLLDDLDLDLL